jgi:hypothetical protein
MKNIDYYIRDLAKTDYWQSLYIASKQNNGVQLFENSYNFSSLQVQFLQWLSLYSLLYNELSQHENKFLTEAVINNHVRADAYLYMRRKTIELEWKKHQKEKHIDELKSKHKNAKHEVSEVIDVQFRG